ncbi:MAG: exodeoxyribonuclease VII large subunit [bacterium]
MASDKMDFFEDDATISEEEQRQTLSVTDATRMIKTLLETTLPMMWIEGEISNFIHHSSGHMYFSMKDENSQIPCVMWAGRNRSLHFKPQDGMKVLVQGRITVYERRGQYQLDVWQMLPGGVGALQLAFDQLKIRLSEEGLFDEKHKKPIPKFPQRIGIVTSQTGAAIRDLRSVITRRWPPAEIILRPALVQGTGAAEDVANAIQEFNEFGEVDVLIVGRGGGSLEDLWAFNEEIVVRAIFKSKIPVISAIGHEIDFTIADFVADLRAPTPSAAAELVVPDAKEIYALLSQKISRAYSLTKSAIKDSRNRLNSICRSYGFKRPKDFILQNTQKLDELRHRLEVATKQRLNNEKFRLAALERQLSSLSFQNVLKRGFTITKTAQNGNILKTVKDVKPDEEMRIVFHDGVAEKVFQKR